MVQSLSHVQLLRLYGLCNLPGFSVRGIFQTRILEWVAIPSSEDLPNPGIEPPSPALQADSLPSELPALPPHPPCGMGKGLTK